MSDFAAKPWSDRLKDNLWRYVAMFLHTVLCTWIALICLAGLMHVQISLWAALPTLAVVAGFPFVCGAKLIERYLRRTPPKPSNWKSRCIAGIVAAFVALLLAFPYPFFYIADRFASQPNEQRYRVETAADPLRHKTITKIYATHGIDLGDGVLLRKALENAIASAQEQDQIKRPIIHLVTASTGGDVIPTDVMVSAIKNMRPHAMVITEIPVGEQCASSCTLLFLAGERRLMYPTSTLLFHEVDTFHAVIPGVQVDLVPQLFQPVVRLVEFFRKSMQASIRELASPLEGYLSSKTHVFSNPWYGDRCSVIVTGWQMDEFARGVVELPLESESERPSRIFGNPCKVTEIDKKETEDCST